MPSYYYPEPPDDYYQDNDDEYKCIEEAHMMWGPENKRYGISGMGDRHLKNSIEYIKNSRSYNFICNDESKLIQLLLMEIELLKRRLEQVEQKNHEE